MTDAGRIFTAERKASGMKNLAVVGVNSLEVQ